MKKIIILYAKFGGGHLSAATSLKEYIDINYPWKYEVKLIDFFEYTNNVLNKISTNFYAESVKHFPWIYWRMYYDTNHMATSNIVKHWLSLLSFRMNKLIQEENPDIVVSCHPYASIMCSRIKEKKKLNFLLASIVTDFALHELWVSGYENIDYIFVSHENMKKDLIWKWVDSKKVFVTWIPISNRFLWKFEKSEIIKKYWLIDNKKTVLFFWGWEYGLSNKRIINILKCFIDHWKYLQVLVISWKNEKMKKKFENLVKQTKSENFVKVLGYTDKVPELMFVADLVVTKPGGLTTSESLSSWLPMLLINPIPGQEEENAQFLEEQGVWINIDEKNCTEIVQDLFVTPNVLERMSKKALSLSKINASEDICKSIGITM